MTFQVSFRPSPVLTIQAVKPLCFFIGFVQSHYVTSKREFQICFEIAFVALQPFNRHVRMVQFCVFVQVIFGFGLILTLVTSKPLHSFGCGMFHQHMASQVVFLQGLVLTIEAVKPVGFFVRFVHNHYVRFKRGLQFCFERALFALQPQHFFVWCVFDQFVILHSVVVFYFEVAFVAFQPSAVLFDLYVRMVQFYVFVQLVFGFALVLTLVTSKPLHKFG
jgi:hypothetical protein